MRRKLTVIYIHVVRIMKERTLESHGYTHARLLSNLMNMVRKIQTGLLASLQRSTILTVMFFFVLGYTGVPGNEKSDRLAGLTTILEAQPLDHAAIVNNLRDIARVEGLWEASLSRYRGSMI